VERLPRRRAAVLAFRGTSRHQRRPGLGVHRHAAGRAARRAEHRGPGQRPVGPDIYGPTIRDQVTGADAGALLSGCQADYAKASQAAHITGGAPLGNAYVSEEAFRWIAWTPSDATVDLVSAGPGSQGTTVQATPRVEVVWSGGDWRVVAPPGGDWGNAAAGLSSLSGYTLFPGQE
jgi:hypothetical protein